MILHFEKFRDLPEKFRNLPEIEDNYISYETDNKRSDDKGLSSATIGDIRNGPERLQISQYKVVSTSPQHIMQVYMARCDD